MDMGRHEPGSTGNTVPDDGECSGTIPSWSSTPCSCSDCRSPFSSPCTPPSSSYLPGATGRLAYLPSSSTTLCMAPGCLRNLPGDEDPRPAARPQPLSAAAVPGDGGAGLRGPLHRRSHSIPHAEPAAIAIPDDGWTDRRSAGCPSALGVLLWSSHGGVLSHVEVASPGMVPDMACLGSSAGLAPCLDSAQRAPALAGVRRRHRGPQGSRAAR